MSRQLATGCWLLAREEAWKCFLRERSVQRAPLHRSVLAKHWRAARADFQFLASRQQPVASSHREVLA
jgi:hypothetical protein